MYLDRELFVSFAFMEQLLLTHANNKKEIYCFCKRNNKILFLYKNRKIFKLLTTERIFLMYIVMFSKGLLCGNNME